MTEMSRIGRERLPNRRPAATATAEWNGRPLHVSVGFSNDGRVLEIFCRDARRVDSERDRMVDDAAVLVSRALQHGDTLTAIANGIGRLPNGAASSVIGAIIDAAVKLAQEG
jgi:hypothetical protein